MKHDGLIRNNEGPGSCFETYYADCSCGFIGPRRDYKDYADIDLENHYEEAGEE